MAAPAWLGAAISGGSSPLSGLISGFMNRAENKKARDYNTQMVRVEQGHDWNKWNAENDYSEKVWNIQNQYNEKMWHQLNDYNSPQAQMERFRKAGLNPHLIYGQMGNASPVSTASFQNNSIGSGGSYKSVAPTQWDIDLGGSQFSDALMRGEMNKVQSNNIAAQTALIQQQEAHTLQQTLSTAKDIISKGIQNKRSQKELENINQYSSKAAEMSYQQQQSQLSLTQKEEQVLLDRNEREKALNAATLEQMAANISKLYGETLSADVQRQIHEMDLQLKREGVQPHDNAFMRRGQELLNWFYNRATWKGTIFNPKK